VKRLITKIGVYNLVAVKRPTDRSEGDQVGLRDVIANGKSLASRLTNYVKATRKDSANPETPTKSRGGKGLMDHLQAPTMSDIDRLERKVDDCRAMVEASAQAAYQAER